MLVGGAVEGNVGSEIRETFNMVGDADRNSSGTGWPHFCVRPFGHVLCAMHLSYIKYDLEDFVIFVYENALLFKTKHVLLHLLSECVIFGFK